MAKKSSLTSIVRRNSNTGSLSIILLSVGLLLFLSFNFFTTYDTFAEMLGEGGVIVLLVGGVSAVDLAGLTRVITPEADFRRERMVVYITFAVWLLAAAVDIVLTAWWAMLRMSETTVAVGVPSETSTFMLNVFPWAVAITEFCIRVPLIIVLGKILDTKLSGRSVSTNYQRSQRKVKGSYPAVAG